MRYRQVLFCFAKHTSEPYAITRRKLLLCMDLIRLHGPNFGALTNEILIHGWEASRGFVNLAAQCHDACFHFALTF